MPTVSQQLAALTVIRKLVMKHFPDSMHYVENLQEEIAIDHTKEKMHFDPAREVYTLETVPVCKICGSTARTLTKIPLISGEIHICRDCRDEIAKSKTLAALA